MVNNDFGENCTPAQVADHLDWYTPGGLVLWTKLALKKTSFVWRTYGFDQNDINKQVADPDKRVLLQVPLSHGSHWLKATHVLKGHLMADDPWFGDECDVLRRYGKITGSALFKRR